MSVSVMVSPEEIPAESLSALDKADALTYESVTNHSRAVRGAVQMCVMCGMGSCSSAGAASSTTASPKGASSSVVIPRQNKDVCRECDKAIWLHAATGAYFKWCKGCKNFLQIGNFSQKLDAAKCDKCRERGRTSYLLKKRSSSAPASPPTQGSSSPDEAAAEPDSAAAISLVALARTERALTGSAEAAAAAEEEEEDDAEDHAAAAAPRDESSSCSKQLLLLDPPGDGDSPSEVVPKVSSSFGCSLVEHVRGGRGPPSEASCGSEEEDPSSGQSSSRSGGHQPEALREKNAPGLLFELAAIHSTILKLEHRAELVAPLEKKVARLTRELDEARVREKAAQGVISRLKRQLDDRDQDDDDDDDDASPTDRSRGSVDTRAGDGVQPVKRPRFISFDSVAGTTQPNDCSSSIATANAIEDAAAAAAAA